MDEVTRQLREFKEKNPRKFAEMLNQLSESELQDILYSWPLWARFKQMPPEGKWRFWVLSGGRSSGKTKGSAEWVIERARQGKGPIALIGKTTGDVRDVMVELGPSSIMQCSPPDFKAIYEPSKRRLTWPNGVTATTFSGDEPGQLKGPQHQTIWVDELPKFADPQSLFDDANFGLRIGDSRCLISTTPTPHPLMKSLYKQWEEDKEGRVRYVIMPTQDNAANVDPEFIKDIEDKYKGTRLYRQEVLGEILWESEDALFSSELLDKYRVDEAPELDAIAIAVDIATTSNKSSDDTGIIVGGRGVDNHGYVLDDKTMKGSPSQWANMVVSLYDHYSSIAPAHVVIETNQGGDLIKHTLMQVRQNLPIKEVRANKSKIARMEPISLLAEQGKIHMVGYHEKLEEELVSYNGKGRSPNRFDAKCYAMTSLLINPKRNIVTSSEFFV
jgi:phage terminase large subunit-like protein